MRCRWWWRCSRFSPAVLVSLAVVARRVGFPGWSGGVSTLRVFVGRRSVGQRLQGLPRLAEAAAAGRLSADQARPVSQLADTESDAAWAVQAQGLSAAVLARQLTRRHRPVAADHRAARAARHLRAWEHGHELLFRGALPVDDGRRLLAAIERAMPDRDPHADVAATPDQRRADGLAALAGANLAADTDPDRATVLVIAELAAIDDADPAATAELEASQPLATATGCCATAAPSWRCRTVTGCWSGSVPPNARSAPSCGGRSCTATGAAGSESAPTPGSFTPITSCTGRPRPPWATSCSCATPITTPSTKAAGPSPATPTTNSAPPTPPTPPRSPANPNTTTRFVHRPDRRAARRAVRRAEHRGHPSDRDTSPTSRSQTGQIQLADRPGCAENRRKRPHPR